MELQSTGVYRKRANLILTLVSILYGAVFLGQFYVHSPWYDALYWVVQSALIGSVADWFAVTALFRKPLGISFHTELIPRNKERLIHGVVNMVETKLLTFQQCQQALERMRFFPFIDGFMTSESGRQTMRDLTSGLVKTLWEQRSEEEWTQWGASQVKAYLAQQDKGPWLRAGADHLMGYVSDEQRITRSLAWLQQRLRSYETEEWLTRIIHEEIERRKQGLGTMLLIFLSQQLDILNPRDMARTMLTELDHTLGRWQEEDNEERLAWTGEWIRSLHNTLHSEEWQAFGEEALTTWMDSQSWEQLIGEYILPLVKQLIYGTHPHMTSLGVVCEQLVQDVWQEYRGNAYLQERLEDVLHHLGYYLLEKGHPLIGVVVRQVLESFDTEKFVQFVESKVDDDLSWIRINGAIVGGGCGFLIWAFLYLLYEPFLQWMGI